MLDYGFGLVCMIMREVGVVGFDCVWNSLMMLLSCRVIFVFVYC